MHLPSSKIKTTWQLLFSHCILHIQWNLFITRSLGPWKLPNLVISGFLLYIRVKIQRNIKSWDQQNDLVIRGFCYIRPLYSEVPLYLLIVSPGSTCPRILWIQQRYAAAASHSCVRSNSCVSWRISFQFCMEVYLGKIYAPIVFGDAAPSVPSFIGAKVIFWWKSCVHSAGHISWRISFNFFLQMCIIVKSTHL